MAQGAGRWRRWGLAAAAAAFGLAVGVAGPVAAAHRPAVVMLIAPQPMTAGVRGELAVQVYLPKTVRRHGHLVATLYAPAQPPQAIPMTAVGGGAYEGTFPVLRQGRYRVTVRYTAQGRTWTLSRSVVAGKANPLSGGMRLAVAVVLFGAAWLFLTRRRRP